MVNALKDLNTPDKRHKTNQFINQLLSQLIIQVLSFTNRGKYTSSFNFKMKKMGFHQPYKRTWFDSNKILTSIHLEK